MPPIGCPGRPSRTADGGDCRRNRHSAAGGRVVKQAAAAQWGGYYGYFSDPDGYLWKVASPS